MEVNKEKPTSELTVKDEVEEISQEEVVEDDYSDDLIGPNHVEVILTEEDDETEKKNESATEEKETKRNKSVRKKDKIKSSKSQKKSKSTLAINCRKCLKEFKSVSSYIRHKCSICPTCGILLTDNKEMARHLRSHSKSSDKPFICKICARRFNDKTTLGMHGRVHHNYPPTDGGASCENCEEKFKSVRARDEHVRAFHKIVAAANPSEEGNQYNCKLCEKKFAKRKNLLGHIRNVHSEDKKHNYECKFCKKIYRQSHNLSSHVKKFHNQNNGELGGNTVLKVKPHCCQFCDKRFAAKHTLKLHIQTHSGERPHGCQICEKGFLTKQNLQKHMKVHTGERFEPGNRKESEHAKCDFCDKEFRLGRNLAHHIKTIHQGERRHLCQYCGKSFAAKGNLDVHVRLHTGERPYGCQFCEKRFPDRGGLKSHVKFHHPGKKIRLGRPRKYQDLQDPVAEIEPSSVDSSDHLWV